MMLLTGYPCCSPNPWYAFFNGWMIMVMMRSFYSFVQPALRALFSS